MSQSTPCERKRMTGGTVPLFLYLDAEWLHSRIGRFSCAEGVWLSKPVRFEAKKKSLTSVDNRNIFDRTSSQWPCTYTD